MGFGSCGLRLFPIFPFFSAMKSVQSSGVKQENVAQENVFKCLEHNSVSYSTVKSKRTRLSFLGLLILALADYDIH